MSTRSVPIENRPPSASIESAAADLRRGQFIVILDDRHRENEGDLILAAEKVTPARLNYMITHARATMCLIAIIGSRLDELAVPLMVKNSTDRFQTPFAVSVDAKEGTSTGVSVFDKAKTVKAILDPRTRPQDLAQPGHVFPLRASEGGVLERPGHTEAAVDLARIAGLFPACMIAEIMNQDGSMAGKDDITRFASARSLKVVTVNQIIAHLKKHLAKPARVRRAISRK